MGKGMGMFGNDVIEVIVFGVRMCGGHRLTWRRVHLENPLVSTALHQTVSLPKESQLKLEYCNVDPSVFHPTALLQVVGLLLGKLLGDNEGTKLGRSDGITDNDG